MYEYKLSDPLFLPHIGCEIQVSLGRGQGEVFLGENGVGKTSFLRRCWSDLRRKFPIVFIEQSALQHFYDRPLHDFKRIFLASTSETLDPSRFENYWRRFGLHEKSNRRLSQLSGGEGQALKLACGLGQRGEIYLLDEPSQYLDEERKALLSEILEELKKDGKSLLIVEHDVSWLSFDYLRARLLVKDGQLVREVYG